MLNKGDKVKCVVLSVDQEKQRIALGLKQMANDPWEGDIPGRYHPGDVVKGKVTKITNFGVFVELEPGLEGLLHISELADHKVESPKTRQAGRGNRSEDSARRCRRAQDRPEPAPVVDDEKEGEEPPHRRLPDDGAAKRARELRGGTGSGGDLIKMPETAPKPE